MFLLISSSGYPFRKSWGSLNFRKLDIACGWWTALTYSKNQCDQFPAKMTFVTKAIPARLPVNRKPGVLGFHLPVTEPYHSRRARWPQHLISRKWKVYQLHQNSPSQNNKQKSVGNLDFYHKMTETEWLLSYNNKMHIVQIQGVTIHSIA